MNSAHVRWIIIGIGICVVGIIGYKGKWRIWHSAPSVVSLVCDETQLQKFSPLIPVAIIGSGSAGLSAAVYAARSNRHTVVFTGSNPGGQLMGTTHVENWPGLGKMVGADLIRGLQEQAERFGAVIVRETVTQLDAEVWPYRLTLSDGQQVYALTVIAATGSVPVTLGVAGEREYWGKGVTTCAICDAPFYKDCEVVVVGGGDSAVEEALQLAAVAKKVTVLVRSDRMRAAPGGQERLKRTPNIHIEYNVRVVGIEGDGHFVTGVQLVRKDNPQPFLYPTDGVFLAIGHKPVTDMFKPWLPLDEQGCLMVIGRSQATVRPGIFAAGEVADPVYRQAGVAAGDGIKAALDAVAFLRDHGFSDTCAHILEKNYFNPARADLQPLTQLVTLEEFEREVLHADEPVIVDFYTPYCPSCMQMLPLVEQVNTELSGKVRFVKVDGAVSPDLMERYFVTSVPCFLAFKKGLLVARYTSVMSKRELREFAAQFVD